MLSFAGFRLISTPTFTPAYLFLLTGSKALVGVGSSLLQAGMMLSPMLVAAALSHRGQVLPAALRIGLFMRLMILALALVGWVLDGPSAIAATFLVLFLLGMGTGGQRIAFNLLLSKVIPIRRRGRLQGWRNFVGGLIAAGISYLAGVWLIEGDFLGNGYASIFLLTFLLSCAGLLAIGLMMREPRGTAMTVRRPLFAHIASFPSHLADRDFRAFLIAQSTCTLARAAAPFYILFAGSRIGLDGPAVGGLALCFMAADTVSNLLWGRLGDKAGYRITYMLAIGLWIASTLVLMLIPSGFGLALAFCGLGASISGYLMSQQTMVLEFGPREDVAMRLGLTNTLDGIVSAIGPLLGGMVASLFGYDPLFLGSIAMLSITLLLLFRLRDPRRET
ncbi:MFS transporter [Sphingosinithalassobacter tenebrarum]|uniref:MFS transporter n=2 Tax=Stakelama tenebrarum TaxID=2711215 RepID=A0A6G6YA09_9SPHN|nr:MFS transporter [Sphingosinithalassobacter tenebrarum]